MRRRLKERAGEEDLDSERNRPPLSNIARCLACLTLLPRQSKEPTRDPNKTSLGPTRSMRHQTNGAECSNNPEDNPVATMEMDTEPSGMSGYRIRLVVNIALQVAGCRSDFHISSP